MIVYACESKKELGYFYTTLETLSKVYVTVFVYVTDKNTIDKVKTQNTVKACPPKHHTHTHTHTHTRTHTHTHTHTLSRVRARTHTHMASSPGSSHFFSMLRTKNA